MADISEDWGVDVDRGPDWLFLKLKPGRDVDDVADRIWSVADRHFVYRLVLEMDDVGMLPSRLMGQLVLLQKRVMQRQGSLRLCGLSNQCEQALHMCRLDQALPNYGNREDAVMGSRRPHFSRA